MKPPKVSEKSPHRLLVEGKDDLHTVIHLLRRHGLDYDSPPQGLPYIHATDGYSPLLDALSVAAKSYKRLGVVIDADLIPNQVDDAAAMLAKTGLSGAENWIFDDPFTARLRFEIDPRWQGEIPRTMLIAHDGKIMIIEGVAEPAQVRTWLDQQRP